MRDHLGESLRKAMRLSGRGSLAILALLAGGCGALNPFGGSSDPAPQRTPPAPTAPASSPIPQPQVSRAPAPVPPPVVQRRGGGYYQDDGPGDNPPPNLELTPDAIPRDEPPLRSATNRNYVVFGKTYQPFTDNRPFMQRGIGSWYGRKFHGQKTSSGEPYDMYAMTAAHPTLPIPSYVRVTNVANGRSVVVRVNDRGPFHSDRIIDLSYTAALKLDYISQGSTLVDVVRVREGDRPPLVASAGSATAGRSAPTNTSGDGPAEPPPVVAANNAPAQKPAAKPAAPPAAKPVAAAAPVVAPAVAEPATTILPTATQPDGVYLQIGAFGARDNAESFKAHVSRELAWLTDTIFVVPAGAVSRVQIGPYRSRDEANKIAERIRESLQLKPVFVLK